MKLCEVNEWDKTEKSSHLKTPVLAVWGMVKARPKEKLFEFFSFIENEESRFQFLFILLVKMFRCCFFCARLSNKRKKFNKPQFLPQKCWLKLKHHCSTVAAATATAIDIDQTLLYRIPRVCDCIYSLWSKGKKYRLGKLFSDEKKECERKHWISLGLIVQCCDKVRSFLNTY